MFYCCLRWEIPSLCVRLCELCKFDNVLLPKLGAELIWALPYLLWNWAFFLAILPWMQWQLINFFSFPSSIATNLMSLVSTSTIIYYKVRPCTGWPSAHNLSSAIFLDDVPHHLLACMPAFMRRLHSHILGVTCTRDSMELFSVFQDIGLSKCW